MIPSTLHENIEKTIGSRIVKSQSVGGGSINEAARIETADATYFVKWNNASRYPLMFESEAIGLNLLKKHSQFAVPGVISVGTAGIHSYILMAFLERGKADWIIAGATLADMHRTSSTQFGLGHNNYIGSLNQSNLLHDSWSAFYSSERILPQVKLALDNGLLNHADLNAADMFCRRIDDIFPNEPSSLLHGDLWSGNMLFSIAGPSVYDPAVYYGHREMDIAMTRLFGGFDDDFYIGYSEKYPLQKNWEQRIDYCNLYPFLVHVNLFGGSYINEVRRILRDFK